MNSSNAREGKSDRLNRKRDKHPSRTIFLLIVFTGVFGLRIVESATPVLEYGKVFNNLGLVCEQKEHPKKALRYYQKAIMFNPGLAEAYSNMASLLFKNQDYDKAIVYAQKAIDLDHLYHQAYHTLGLAYRAKGEYQMALKFFARAYDLYNHYPYVHHYKYDLGIAYLDVGEKGSAKQCVQDLRALKEDKMADQLEQYIAKFPAERSDGLEGLTK